MFLRTGEQLEDQGSYCERLTRAHELQQWKVLPKNCPILLNKRVGVRSQYSDVAYPLFIRVLGSKQLHVCGHYRQCSLDTAMAKLSGYLHQERHYQAWYEAHHPNPKWEKVRGLPASFNLE